MPYLLTGVLLSTHRTSPPGGRQLGQVAGAVSWAKSRSGRCFHFHTTAFVVLLLRYPPTVRVPRQRQLGQVAGAIGWAKSRSGRCSLSHYCICYATTTVSAHRTSPPPAPAWSNESAGAVSWGKIEGRCSSFTEIMPTECSRLTVRVPRASASLVRWPAPSVGRDRRQVFLQNAVFAKGVAPLDSP